MIQPYDSNVNNGLSTFKFPSQNNNRDITTIIEGSERQFLGYIVDMFSVLNKDKIDLEKFNDVVEALMYLKKEQESDYYTYLIRPEKSRGCKIPSRIPIPSSSFQLKQSVNISTNALGNVALAFVPVFLGTPVGSSGGTFYVNNDVTLTGSASSNFFISRDIGQIIPPVYSQYRVVSASIVVKYTGRMDIVQGVIGGAIVFDTNVANTVYGTADPDLAKYGDFNIAQDAFFQQEHHLMHGIREIFFPLDNSYEIYARVDTVRAGFVNFVYILGGPPSSNVAKVDIFVNYECLPDATFLNYVPTSPSPSYSANNEELIRKAQKEPIMKETQALPAGESKSEKSIFDKVVDTLGVVIPGVADIAKIIGKFII